MKTFIDDVFTPEQEAWMAFEGKLYEIGYLLQVLDWLRDRGELSSFCDQQIQTGRENALTDIRKQQGFREWDIPTDTVPHIRALCLRAGMLTRSAP